MTTKTAVTRPRRADARRNRERLVAAAATVFAEEGANAPLDKIARAAGIGNATMYRHFPTREALLEAVLHDVYRELIALAEQLSTVTPAIDAVDRWLRAFINYSQTYLDLPEPIIAAAYDETSALYASCKAMRSVATRLIGRAQEDGTLRADIDILDLCAQASGIAWATQRSPDREQVTRMLAMLINGLRA
ncbi:TetR/AcrR family transcriptional regulator [Acrocarpospora macrocephala]|uniref:TetR family transcriptional regulator n=1 Tax=Acrocarpospora macrocephala TaxID=150177 RepID=A0A5M3WWV2_9ACTN|nr:TetR/AcrR family transcriptional regulator [Acrocarpospora macrocephala]GES11771.1 TetR family transcriptional regulator [Acrocarpospora macrocephala]